jgi:hypothetical protein
MIWKPDYNDLPQILNSAGDFFCLGLKLLLWMSFEKIPDQLRGGNYVLGWPTMADAFDRI